MKLLLARIIWKIGTMIDVFDFEEIRGMSFMNVIYILCFNCWYFFRFLMFYVAMENARKWIKGVNVKNRENYWRLFQFSLIFYNLTKIDVDILLF